MLKLKNLPVLITKIILLTLFLGSCKEEDTSDLVEININDATFLINENPDKDQVIGTVSGSATIGEDPVEIVYSIQSSSVQNAVSINSTTGVITVSDPSSFIFENNSQILLIVSGTVNGKTAEAIITIQINEPDSVIINVRDTSFYIYENAPNNQSIGFISAEASLGSESTTLTYELLNQTLAGAISIDSETGEIKVADPSVYDYEVNQSFTAQVVVKSLEVEKEIAVTINIQNVVEGFVTSWQTTQENESITIYTRSLDYSYSYDIDWGDGTKEENVSGDAEHSYDTAGTYQVGITGVFPAIHLGANEQNALKIVSIDSWSTIAWQTMNEAFSNCKNLEYNASDIPDLSQVSDASSMFFYAENFDGDLNNWNVSQISDMNKMFGAAFNFNGNISSWDVSNVTNMSNMFVAAYLFNQDISNWNTQNVTDMSYMFSNALAFNQNIGNWDVGNVTEMSSMFSCTTSQGTSSFNQNLNNWNVSKVTEMWGMFWGAKEFDSPIGNWDVSNVRTMWKMFEYASKFNQDISNWDVSTLQNMSEMFYGCTVFNSDISNWDVSNVSQMSRTFFNCKDFNQDITNWDVSNVSTMELILTYCESFDQNLGSWNISDVTNMERALEGSGLSTTNYDASLTGWANLASVPQNITLGAGNLLYCADGETARNTLINTHGWTISGDSKATTDQCN